VLLLPEVLIAGQALMVFTGIDRAKFRSSGDAGRSTAH